MNTKQEYKYGDMLKLADGSVVRFLERGGIPGNLIVQVNREGDKNIINEDNVVERKPRHEYVSSYARK